MRTQRAWTSIFALTLLAAGLSAAGPVWADSVDGIDESANTSAAHPSRYVTDLKTYTYWQLETGATVGWTQRTWAQPQTFTGAQIDALLPAGVELRLSTLENNHWVPIAGALVSGPLDGTVDLAFGRDLKPSTKLLISLSGDRASLAEVREVNPRTQEALVPFGKITPLKTSLNQDEYINLKASRLWDGILNSAWFEPIWSQPWEVNSTNDANRPQGVFPPYFGNPPRDAEIVWELDGTYQIQVLKAYLLQEGRNLRFEFWDGARWTAAKTFGEGWSPSGTAWQRIDLTTPVSTNKIRITFPGGWERARFIGEVEVWGSGWADERRLALTIPEVGEDQSRLYTLTEVPAETQAIDVTVGGRVSTPLSGTWNGVAFQVPPATWINQETIYQIPIAVTALRTGPQFLRLNQAAAVKSVVWAAAPNQGQVMLGWPYDQGLWGPPQPGPGVSVPADATRLWKLGASYSLERVRIWGSDQTLRLKAGVIDRRGQIKWTEVSWRSQGDGWREAVLSGLVADQLLLESVGAPEIDQVQITGSPLADTRVGMEIWWPKAGSTVTSFLGDGNSVIGWMGDPQVQPLIGGHHPRQADKVFWMPLSQMGLRPNQEATLAIEGTQGSAAFHGQWNVRWMHSLPGTFDQGEALVSTLEEAFTLSGSINKSRSRVFINGVEVLVAGGRFTSVQTLADGYQKFIIEIWDAAKKDRLIAWTKEVVKARGLPLLELDLPRGDEWTQTTPTLVTGRVGNGTGLSLTINGQAAALTGNQFSAPITLPPGAQTVSLVLTDELGRTTTQGLTIHQDSVAPTIEWVEPVRGAYLNHSAVTLTAQSAGEAGLWWQINDEDWVYDPASGHTVTVALPDGGYQYRISAKDRAGNLSGSQTMNFVVDVTSPEPFAIQADVQGWSSNSSPTLTFLTTDATSGVAHYEYTIDGGEWSVAVSPLTLAPLTEGPHMVFVRAIDRAGNTTLSTLEVKTDTVPPQAFAATANVSGWTSNTRPVVSFSTTDATSGVARYEVQIDTGPWTEQASPFQLPVLADGVHTLAVRAWDQASNSTLTGTLTLQIDATAPAPFTAAANVAGWTSNTRPTVSFGTTDATSGVERFEVRIDDGPWLTQNSPYQTPVLADGPHILAVRALDRAGNSSASAVTVQTDATSPSPVTDLRGIPGKGSVDILWSAVSDLSGVVRYHVTRSPAWQDGSRETVVPLVTDSGLTSGEVYTYTVWAEDGAGNLGTPVEAPTSIVGLAVSAVNLQNPAETTLVEYKNLKVIVPNAVLPAETAAVIVQELTSPDLVQAASYPLASPIYSISTLARKTDGSLQETAHSEFDKPVMMVLDYDPTLLPADFPENNLGVYYFDTTWGKWFKVDKTMVDVEQHKVVFTTNHFTSFSVQPTMVADLSPQQLKDIGHSPFKSESAAGMVTVSPQGGTAMTEVTDFVLQGKNGFTLPIRRMYDTGTALADSPSLNLSATLSFNSFKDMVDVAAIGLKLATQGVKGMTNSIADKVMSAFKRNGDWALAAGVGWRLSLPYVFATNTSVALRLPSGGYHTVGQMQSSNNFWTSNPVNRTLDFEFHEGEDFHFKVYQTRLDFTTAGMASVGAATNEAISRLTKNGAPDDPGAVSVVSMVASAIPGWNTYKSELWTKDGTHYVFNQLGAVTDIWDKTETSHFHFEYDGLLLNKITDDLGRTVHFSYNQSSLQSLFVKPVIDKIWTKGFATSAERAVKFTYDTDTANGFFNFLPTLSSTKDALGRQYSYSYDQKSIITGGGSLKINVAALLLDIFGASGVADFLGIAALTLSGHIEINLPYTLRRVVAPGVGTTEVTVSTQDLSEFDFRITDYFLGIIPTAAEVSYQILFRLQTTRVKVISSTGVARTTNYSYDWSREYLLTGNQFYVSSATVDDGRTRVVHRFSPHSVWRNRFISWDDYLLAVAQQLFQSEPYAVPELFTLESGTSTYDVTKGGVWIESVSNSWDLGTRRLMASTTRRGDQVSATRTYRYDSWGNQTYVKDQRLSGDREEVSEQWQSYVGQGVPSWWTIPDLAGDESLSNGEIRNLVKYSLTRRSLPSQAGGGSRDVYRRSVYNALGQTKLSGLWLGDQWSTTGLTYHTSGLASGSAASQSGPLPGQLTTWDYDYSSHPGSLYTVKQTIHQVKDVTGISTDLVQETTYDWNTALTRYQKDARGFVTEYAYDLLGRLTDTVKPADEGQSETPWEHIAYDDSANSATVYRQPNRTSATLTPPLEKYSYDTLGQLTLVEKFNDSLEAETVKTQVTYDPWGNVASMTDPNGNTTGYAYDALGHLIKTTYADGTSITTAYILSQNQRTTTNERGVITIESLNWAEQPQTTTSDYGFSNLISQVYYDGQGVPVVTVDPLKQVTTTTYNAFDKPSTITHPAVDAWEASTATPVPASFSPSPVVPVETLTYDLAGNLTLKTLGTPGHQRRWEQTFDLAGRLIKSTTGDSSETREEWNWYDAGGNLVKHADSLAVTKIQAGTLSAQGSEGMTTSTYTPRGQLATQTDPSGATVRYQYDWQDRKVQMKDPRANPGPQVIDNFTITYRYNALNRLVEASLPPVTGGSRTTQTIEYDLRGNATRQVDQAGRVTTTIYDNRNRPERQTLAGADGSGTLVTTWAYDETGNITEEAQIDSASQGKLAVTKTWDHFNRVVETTLPDDQKSINYYDELGRIFAVRDAAGRVTNHGYNSLNLVVLTTDALGNTTRHYYNQWGDATATSRSNDTGGDQNWQRTYNPFGQIVEEANNAGQLWSYRYDPRGLMQSVTDPNQTTTTQHYDPMGRLVDKNLVNASRTQSQSWTYDPAGALKTATDGQVVTRINQATGSFVADPYDLITSLSVTVGAKTLTHQYQYNAAHNPTRITYPDQALVDYQYNPLQQLVAIPGFASDGQYNFAGRLTQLKAPNGTQRTKDWNPTTGTLDGYHWNVAGKNPRTLKWDNLGNLTSQSKDNTTSTYSYDDLNRLTSTEEGGKFETQTDTSMPNGSAEGDVAGLEALNFASPFTPVKLDYLASSLGVDLNEVQAINKVRLVGTSPRLKPANIELYVSLTNEADTLGEDGSRSVWTKVEELTWVQDQSGITFQFARAYDARFLKVHSTWDERTLDNQGDDHSTVAGPVAQLIQVSYLVDGQTTSWSYDSAGNRLEQIQTRGNTTTTEYTYWPHTNLIKTAGDWAFEYDQNHNLIRRTHGVTGEAWTYTWDLLNRLNRVQHQKTAVAETREVASYVYDATNLRVAQTKPSANGPSLTTYFAYDQNGDLLWTEDGTTETKYVQALGQIWAEVRTNAGVSTTYWHHTDHLGSTEVITDGNGAVVWSGSYEAFGMLAHSNGTLEFTPSYVGRQYDADIGMSYHNARFYLPELGVFISEDPIRAGDNWTTYSRNPLNRLDPSGLLDRYYRNNDGAWFVINPINDAIDDYTKGSWANQQNARDPFTWAINGLGGLLGTVADVAIPDNASEAAQYIGGGGEIAKVGSLFKSAARSLVAKESAPKPTNVNSFANDLKKTLEKQTPKLLPRAIPPRGFSSVEQFESAMGELNSILKSNNIDDAVFRFRGTATTGLSENPNKRGKFFDESSDIDLSIESTQLSQLLYASGQKTSQNVPGLFLPEKVKSANADLYKQLTDWNTKWKEQLHHDIKPAVTDPAKVKANVKDVTYVPNLQ